MPHEANIGRQPRVTGAPLFDPRQGPRDIPQESDIDLIGIISEMLRGEPLQPPIDTGGATSTGGITPTREPISVENLPPPDNGAGGAGGADEEAAIFQQILEAGGGIANANVPARRVMNSQGLRGPPPAPPVEEESNLPANFEPGGTSAFVPNQNKQFQGLPSANQSSIDPRLLQVILELLGQGGVVANQAFQTSPETGIDYGQGTWARSRDRARQ